MSSTFFQGGNFFFQYGFRPPSYGRRCRSTQIFGGAKHFCPNFPKLARKNFEPLVRIFSHWMTSTKKVSMWFQRRFFFKSKHVGCHFCRISTDFQGFCPDFHQIKTFGGALAHPTPPPPTPLVSGLGDRIKKL